MSSNSLRSSIYRSATSALRRYRGSCFCGLIQFECNPPVRAPVCHCLSCQSLHGAPFVWSVVLEKDSFHFLQGAESIHKFGVRYTCSRCHGKLVDEGDKYFYSFPSVFRFPSGRVPECFLPTHHCFYPQRLMDIHDDRPKFVAKWGSTRWTEGDD